MLTLTAISILLFKAPLIWAKGVCVCVLCCSTNSKCYFSPLKQAAVIFGLTPQWINELLSVHHAKKPLTLKMIILCALGQYNAIHIGIAENVLYLCVGLNGYNSRLCLKSRNTVWTASHRAVSSSQPLLPQLLSGDQNLGHALELRSLLLHCVPDTIHLFTTVKITEILLPL